MQKALNLSSVMRRLRKSLVMLLYGSPFIVAGARGIYVLKLLYCIIVVSAVDGLISATSLISVISNQNLIK